MADQLARILESILTSYGEVLPYHKGKGKIIDTFISLFPLLAKGRRECVRQGLLWNLDLECLIQRSIYYTGWYEIWDTLIAKKFISPGSIVIDVGANIGYYSMLFGQWVGPNGAVHAFEPSRHVFSQLCKHITINNMPWIKAHPFALGDQTTRLLMTSELANNRGVQHILLNRSEINQQLNPIEVTTLDYFTDKIELRRCDFIKVDIEGFEMKFLLGAQKTIKKFHPRILIELNTKALKAHGSDSEEILFFLGDLGYKFYRAKNNNLQLFTEQPNLSEYWNIFATPQ